MVGLVSAMRVLGGGLHNYGFTVFFLPLSQDLGLSRAATSLAFSLARAEGALEGPFVGYLIDRFGPRPMILLATVLCGVGYILLAWVDNYTTFLIVYLGIISLSFTPGFVHALDGRRQYLVHSLPRARHDGDQLGRADRRHFADAALGNGGANVGMALGRDTRGDSFSWSSAYRLGIGVRPSPESMGLLPDGDAPRTAGNG